MIAKQERDPIAIGIKKKIIETGLMQKSIASRAGFTQQQFSDMLNGRRVIRAIDIFRISTAMGIEVADLYEECKHSE